MWEQIRKNKKNSARLIIIMVFVYLLVGAFTGDSLIGLIPYAVNSQYGHLREAKEVIDLSDMFKTADLIGSMGWIIGLIVSFLVWIFLYITTFYTGYGRSTILKSTGAKKVRYDDHKMLFNIVEEMKIAAALPNFPEIYIIDSEALNAFAIGTKPENSAIALTSGLIKNLNRDELQGVIAHEISHIKNYDTRYLMTAMTFLGGIIFMSYHATGISRRNLNNLSSKRKNSVQDTRVDIFIRALFSPFALIGAIFLMFSPLISELLYFALSRQREYLADACAVQYTRFPSGLANALAKISSSKEILLSANRLNAPMFIVNPLSFDKVRKKLSDLSSTHPSISERIKILKKMGAADVKEYNEAYKSVKSTNSSLLSFAELSSMAAIPIREDFCVQNPVEEKIELFRTTEDLLWKLNDYIFILCGCETKLKIPKFYSGKEISCPHCKKPHLIVD